MDKIKRQKEILKIISENEIQTQEELLATLKTEGYETTQATVSRDIRELGLRKKHIGTGGQKYTAPDNLKLQMDAGKNGSYQQILSSAVTGVSSAGNIIVVKTYSGMAMAVAAAIDALEFSEIVGSIAGDDTIMCACDSDEDAEILINKVYALIRGN